MKKFLFIIISALLLSGCSNDDDFIRMCINETGCANAWDDFYDGTYDYKYAVKEYLESENIKVFKVDAERYSDGPFCMACTCSTGRIIIIEIATLNLSKAEELGFIIFDPNLTGSSV